MFSRSGRPADAEPGEQGRQLRMVERTATPRTQALGSGDPTDRRPAPPGPRIGVLHDVVGLAGVQRDRVELGDQALVVGLEVGAEVDRAGPRAAGRPRPRRSRRRTPPADRSGSSTSSRRRPAPGGRRRPRRPSPGPRRPNGRRRVRAVLDQCAHDPSPRCSSRSRPAARRVHERRERACTALSCASSRSVTDLRPPSPIDGCHPTSGPALGHGQRSRGPRRGAEGATNRVRRPAASRGGAGVAPLARSRSGAPRPGRAGPGSADRVPAGRGSARAGKPASASAVAHAPARRPARPRPSCRSMTSSAGSPGTAVDPMCATPRPRIPPRPATRAASRAPAAAHPGSAVDGRGGRRGGPAAPAGSPRTAPAGPVHSASTAAARSVRGAAVVQPDVGGRPAGVVVAWAAIRARASASVIPRSRTSRPTRSSASACTTTTSGKRAPSRPRRAAGRPARRPRRRAPRRSARRTAAEPAGARSRSAARGRPGRRTRPRPAPAGPARRPRRARRPERRDDLGQPVGARRDHLAGQHVGVDEHGAVAAPAGAPRSTCPIRSPRSAPPAARGATATGCRPPAAARPAAVGRWRAGPVGGTAGEAGGVVGGGGPARSHRREHPQRQVDQRLGRGRPPGSGWSGRTRVSVAGP